MVRILNEEGDVHSVLSSMTLPDGPRLGFVYDGFARRLEKRVVRRDAVVRHRYCSDGEDLLEETARPRHAGG